MRKNAVINLELAKDESLGVKFYAKQYDDVKIKARVFDGLDAIKLDGQEVIVFIQKPDDTIVEQMDGVEIVNDEIVINLSKQATTALGECDVEVILRDEEGETATSTVSYVVIEKLSTAIIDVIQSSSDIHHLQLIEELIERADASLLSIETDIREIQEHLSDVEDNINAEYEGIMTALKALEEEIIDNVNFVAEEAKTEALDVIGTSKEEAVRAVEAIKEDAISSANDAVGVANEAVNNATNAVNKANEALETINEVKGEVDKIPGIVATALSDIDIAKDDALDDIAMAHVNLDNAKDEAISAVGSAKAGAVNAINESKASGVSALDTARASAIGEIGVIKEDAVVGIESTRDEAISGVEAVKEEAIRETNDEVIGIKTRTIEELETGATGIKTRTIEDISGGADNIVLDVDAQIKAIKDGAISQVENIKAEAVSSINEAKVSAVSGVENTGDEQVARVTRQGETSISEINTNKELGLSEINTKLNEVKAELEGLVLVKDDILSANETGEITLANLLDAIRRAEEITQEVEAYIESKSGNHDEIIADIEALRIDVEELRATIESIDLSIFYTKEEVDKAIDNLDIYKGKIGEEKHPEFYKNCPEIAEDEEHYIRHYDPHKKKYRCVYIKKGFFDKAYLSSTSYDRYSITLKATTGRKYVVYDYNEATNEWVLNTGSTADGNLLNAESNIYLDSNVEGYKLYSSSFDIETSSSDSTVFIGAVAGDPYAGVIGTYNTTNSGLYYVEHREEIEGCIKAPFRGSMVINNANGLITQTLTEDNGDISTRVYSNGEWSIWKPIGSEEVKETIDNIVDYGNSIVEPEWDVLPETTYKNVPANPDAETYKWYMKCTHYNYHMIFYFPEDPTGKLAIKDNGDGTLGFARLDDTFTYKTYKGWYKAQNTTNTWTAFSNDNHMINPTARFINAIYDHNFDIVDADNPEKVFRYGSQNVFDGFVADFNDCVNKEIYKVDIRANTILRNAPREDIEYGYLKNVFIDNNVFQHIYLSDNTCYTRCRINGNWNGWTSTLA